MRNNRRFWLLLILLALLPAGWMAAQTPASSTDDRAITREHLISLLRLSPRLTAVVSRDPSLLANQDYVAKNNPDLAQFMQQHPEIARNPEFYLFANEAGAGRPGARLEQYVYPELNYGGGRVYVWERYVGEVMGLIVFVAILTALLWLLRVLLENRRWNRILALQSDVHGKLLDKFGSNQELLAYMNTEAGKRFLEAAPLPAGPELSAPARMSLARVLLPLQAGVVLTLLGSGLFMLRDNPQLDSRGPLIALGTIGIMLGIGFIISAVFAFMVARHFDLLPKRAEAAAAREQL